MELQALLVLCGVVVAGAAAVLLLMGLFSASGTSYEEAIAQQRKATTELLALAESKNKAKKSNKKEKKEKKQAKKEKTKESTVLSSGSDPESEAPVESGVEDDSVPPEKPHVEFQPPVVVDVPRDAPPAVKIRKRGKDTKVKPILLKREDPSCVNELVSEPPPVSNHFEELHPKDEFELLQSSLASEKAVEKKEEAVEKKEVKSVKSSKPGKAASKPTAVESKEEQVRERHNSGEGPKEQRKFKKADKKQVAEDQEVVEEVVPPLNLPVPSELTTEKLMRQAAPAASPPAKQKKKKQDPNLLTLMAAGDGGGVSVSELVRVVQEAALSRNEIQILTETLLNKHHDPLPEHSEWTEGPNDPMQKLKKQLADKEKALADEIEASQALHAKLKELRTTLNAERTRATAAARTADAAQADLHALQARIQRLADDNQALAQEKHMLQSKLSAEAEAQAQRVQMEMHIQRLTEAESGLLQQLGGLQAEASARLVEAGQARMDAAAARDAAILAQQHAADLAQQLQDANRAYAELEQQRQCAIHAEQLAQNELRQAQERLNATNDLQAEIQRLTSRAQTAENNLEKAKEELETQKEQLANEVATLREQLTDKETELVELRQLKAAPAHNGLPADSEFKANELAKVEAVVEALRSELSSAQAASRDQRDQVARLQHQLDTYQQKNNELRTKNWKVMEALQSAEKALQTKSTVAVPAQDALRESLQKAQETQLNEVTRVLRAAYPAASPAQGSGVEWIHSFAANLKAELSSKTAPTKDSGAEDRLNSLQDKNDHLQALVDKYKKIIDDTEGVLSRLQQNVTTEEQRWVKQLADKQKELDDLRHRSVQQMQNKIDSLQAELERANASNHTNSFADAERLTQERLLGGLSDKHNADGCNGPLQVQ